MRALAAVLAVTAVLATSAAAAPGHSETATKGNVTATFSYTKTGDFSYGDIRLTISRGGKTLLDSLLKPGQCDYCDSQPIADVGGGKSLFLRDLDGDGSPEVMLDLYSGGAHCCYFTYIYRYRGGRYLKTRAFWGNAAYSVRDYNRDGKPETQTYDDRFPYTFTAYAFSADPVEILHFVDGRFVDVTKSFPAVVSGDAGQLWRSYLKQRKEKDANDVRGLLAAYLADEYNLGKGDAGWQRILAAWKRGEVSNQIGLGPVGRRYLDFLRRQLHAWGYIGAKLPALPPPDWAAAAIDLKMPVFQPADVGGLRLQRVTPKQNLCGDKPLEQLDAFYFPSGAKHLRIAEAQPRYCGDIGDAKLLAQPIVHAARARLYEYCEGSGCAGAKDAYLLQWTERKVQLTLVARGFNRSELLRLAAGMKLVQ